MNIVLEIQDMKQNIDKLPIFYNDFYTIEYPRESKIASMGTVAMRDWYNNYKLISKLLSEENNNVYVKSNSKNKIIKRYFIKNLSKYDFKPDLIILIKDYDFFCEGDFSFSISSRGDICNNVFDEYKKLNNLKRYKYIYNISN